MDRGEANLLVCCEICAENYSNEEGHVPRVIPCGHSFCETCLTKLQTTTRVSKEHYLPSVSVSGRHRHELYMSHSSGLGTDSHSYRKIVDFTNQYKIICPKCKKQTISDKPCGSLPKNYSFLNMIDDILPVLKSEKKRPKCCKDHTNYVLDMFCHNEEETICLKCEHYGEHKGHNVSRLSEFADRQRRCMEDRIDSLENIIGNYDKLCSAVKEREQELTSKVENIRKDIISKFDSVQSEIKRMLDIKLKAVLNQLDNCSAVQLSLLEENAKHSLNTQDFEDKQAEAKTFLSKADERSIAREKDLLSDMQAKIDETQNHTTCTKHEFEVKVDSADHIVQSLECLVNAWVCCVKETKAASHENVSTVIDRHAPNYGENPFRKIDCKLWCDGALDNCEARNPACNLVSNQNAKICTLV